MKTDLFQSCGCCWVFQICWHIEYSIFTTSSFRIWNSSAGIPSPPLVFFVIMFPKTHLTLNSRMSGSRWVITTSWLSGSLRSFLYSSVHSCHLFLIIMLLLGLCCFCPFCTGGSDQNNLEEKEMQKGKMVVWGDLKNSWENKEAKGKGEKERYAHVNTEFQRIERRDWKKPSYVNNAKK